MRLSSPISLQNAVFFIVVYTFVCEEDLSTVTLKYSQFEVKEVPDPVEVAKMVKCIMYNEHSSKNNQGLVHQLHLNNKSVTHYAKPSLGERFFVHLFELYTSKLPSAAKNKDNFYCKPKARLSQDIEFGITKGV